MIDRPPEGYHYEWIEENADWRVTTPEIRSSRTCSRGGCVRRPVLALNRHQWRDGKRRDMWWVYCSDHAYGRRVRNGRVEVRVLRPDAPEGEVAA